MKKINKCDLPIGLFILLWLFVTLGLIALPVTPRFSNMFAITLLNALFVLIISIVAFLWIHRAPKIKLLSVQLVPMNRRKMGFIWRFSLVSSLIGVLFVAFDRIFMRGIDYSEGVRNARYQWLASDVTGSIFGKLGNLMIPFSYCLLFICIFHWESIVTKKRVLGVAIGFFVQISFAMLNGGRSNILVAIIFIFVCCIIRKGQGKTFFPPLKMKLIVGVTGIFLIFQYCISIFYAFTENSIYYLMQNIYYLGGRLENWYYEYTTPLLNSIINIFMYLFHGSFYSGAVLSNVPTHVSINQNMSLRGLWNILGQLNIIDYQIELPNFDAGSGAFVAVPGILLYDYGYIGFILSSIIIGVLVGVAVKEIVNRKKKLGIIRLTFCFIVLMHIYLSPVTMALGLGYFTFMIFALVAMEIIAGLFYGFSSWTTLDL